MEFKRFDFVETTDYKLGFVASDLMDIPYVHDGSGCANFKTPCSFNEEDFYSFEGYLVYLMPEGKYRVYNKHQIKLFDFDDVYNSSKLFDRATSGLRFHLSLLKMQNEKMMNNSK